MQKREPINLNSSYVWIDDKGDARSVEGGPAFWQRLMTGDRDASRWLLGAGEVLVHSPSWDRHPSGECLIILLRGAIDIVLQQPNQELVTELRKPGDLVVVPRGVWHRQLVHEPSARIFLVAGEGTEQRPVERSAGHS